MRVFAILPILALVLAACASPGPQLGPDGRPLPKVYRIPAGQKDNVQFRLLDALNAVRQASGARNLVYNAQLNAAAATHSRDMSLQNRPWHFGSDGSSPLDRVARAGYNGDMLGENISESFETELETLRAWLESPDTSGVLLDPRATDLGFEWFQEPSGKIWWTLITGQAAGGAPLTN